MSTDQGASAKADRATRASPKPASGLGQKASVPCAATVPSVDEWEERIAIAVKRGCTPAKGGAHNYVVNGMRCLLAELSTSIKLLRLEEFAVEQRLGQAELDAVRAIAAKARGEVA